MKKLLMGLLVAGVAMAGSAFTNVQSSKKASLEAYLISSTGTAPNRTFTYSQSPKSCNSSLDPCHLEAVGSYEFAPSGSGTISESVVNDNTKVSIDTRQGSL